MAETIQIIGRERSYTIHIHSSGVTDIVIFYLTMPQDTAELSALYQRTLERNRDHNYTMVSIDISSWNDELSPWEFQEPSGKMSFAGRGEQLLADLEQAMVPDVCERLCIERDQSYFVIAGYSLAGLFSIWAMYQTKLFQGAVSCSGSLWYPGFVQYAFEHKLQRDCSIYLSLGNKEEEVRNPYMAQVGDATRALCQHYQDDDKVERIILEWNMGNHFKQTAERMTKGMTWMLRCNNPGGKL